MGPFSTGPGSPLSYTLPLASSIHPATLHQAGRMQHGRQSEPWFEVCPRLISENLVITAGPVLEMAGIDDLKSCLIPPPSLPQLWRGLLGVRMVKLVGGGEEKGRERRGGFWRQRGGGTVGDTREANLRRWGKPLSGLWATPSWPLSPLPAPCFRISCFTALSTFLFPFLPLSNQERVWSLPESEIIADHH